MSYLDSALKDGYARLHGEGKKRKIIYVAVNHSERYSDPEEQVRAEYWAELIYRYGYEPARIGVEVTVPDRTPADRADLVVFSDDGRKRPFAVIECKRDGITDAEFNQAVEQACGNGTWAKFRASYVGVVAGQTRRFLDFSAKYGVLEREANIIADLPRQYGKPEEWRFRKNTKDDIRPVSKESLIATIKKCHDTLWGGGQLSTPMAFGELCKLLFVKIRDEKAPRRNGQPYDFQIKTHEPSRKLAERIKAIYKEAQDKEPDVFTDTIKIDDATLRTVVSHMEGISFSKTDLDTKGVAFEQFMDGFFKGDFGQYFTPREVIAFAVEMIQPKNDELILDPACGSGGFLLHALDKVRREAANFEAQGSVAHYNYWHDFAEKRLFGIEINDEIVRVAKMNMIIHDDGHTNVISHDALDRLERIREDSENKNFKENSFDVILTNPPFGAQVKLAERPYLVDFDLGHSETKTGKPKARKNQKTEILFIERVLQFLKPGTGRAAMVLPDGVLTNSSLQYARDFLLERFQLLAVVSLPSTAFSHYDANVKPSVVFLRKRAKNETPGDDEAVFMAVPQKIGYDATGRKCGNDLHEVAKSYKEFSQNPREYTVSHPVESTEPADITYVVPMNIIGNSKRIGSDYSHPERLHALKSIRESKIATRVDRLGDIADFLRETTVAFNPLEYVGLANVESHTGELVETSEEPGKGLSFRFQEDNILFARLRPYLNKVWLAERSGVCSTEFHVVRVKDEQRDEILPGYLAAVLRSSVVVAQTKHMMTGNTHPRLANDDVVDLLIPIPNKDIQQAVVDELHRCRLEARRLREEAAREWEAAKARFEQQLLKGEA